MYIPAVALAKRHKLSLAYWRMPYTHSDNRAWMMNDSFNHPDEEMCTPRAATQFKLEDGSDSTTALEEHGNSGAYVGGTRATGPKLEIFGKVNGRGHGEHYIRPQNVFTSDHAWASGSTDIPAHMIGNVPEDVNPGNQYTVNRENPAGFTDFPFTIGVWIKNNDPTQMFSDNYLSNPAIADSESTGESTVPIFTTRRFKYSGGSWGASVGWVCKLEMVRRGLQGNQGCFDLKATLHSSTADGSDALECLVPVYQTPGSYHIGNGDWSLVHVVYTSTNILIYINGALAGSRNRAIQHSDGGGAPDTIPSAFTWPDTTNFQIALNHDLLDTSRAGMNKVSYSHLTVWDEQLDVFTMHRQATSFRRWLDMRLPDEGPSSDTGDWHFGCPLHRIYSWDKLRDGNEASYSEAAGKAKHRHDGRYVAMYHLRSPHVDLNNQEEDFSDLTPESPLTPTVTQSMVPRIWVEHPPSVASTTTQGDDLPWSSTPGLMEQVGGFFYKDENDNRILSGGNGTTVIAGMVGTHDVNTNTMLFNAKGGGQYGTRGWNMWSGCGPGAIDIANPVDGPDGFALFFTGGTSGGFKFYCPYETRSDFTYPPQLGDAYTATFDLGTQSLPQNEYTAIAVSASASGSGLTEFPQLSWVLQSPMNRGPHESDEILTGPGLPGWPGGDAALGKFPRNQAPHLPRMLYSNTTIQDGSPGSGEFPYSQMPNQGNANADDRNRYGPILVFAEKLTKGRLDHITRLMHGQPLMRTRPALRGCNRHTAFNAPTRILT